jgi:hypothetical protein
MDDADTITKQEIGGNLIILLPSLPWLGQPYAQIKQAPVQFYWQGVRAGCGNLHRTIGGVSA